MSSRHSIAPELVVANGAIDALAAQSLLGKLSQQAMRTAGFDLTPAISKRVITGLVRLIDALVIAASALIVYFWYVHDASTAEMRLYAGVAAVASLASVAIFQQSGCYGLSALRDPVAQIGRLIAGLAFLGALFVGAAFLAKQGESFSRVWFAAWLGMALVALSLLRMVIAHRLNVWARAGRLDRRTVIVGAGPEAETLIRQLEMADAADIRICGVFDDRGGNRAPVTIGGYPKLGTVQELVDFARKHRIDLLIVALPISAEKRVLEMLRTLWVLPVDIRLAAHCNKLRLRPRAYSFIGGVPFLDVSDRPITDWDNFIKSAFDRIVALGALVALAPVMAAVALAVKLESKGPVFFRQKRYGFNNQLIQVFKFRSMYTDKCDAAAAKLVTKDDPRVTRVGKFIRKTSLDELPQLFNVLLGELSLVGPRPHAVQAKAADRLYDEVVEGYFARHKVKPGITGWAQINGWRGETDTEDKIQRRVEHDIHYIENWSVLLDVYILFRTPLSLLSHKENAY